MTIQIVLFIILIVLLLALVIGGIMHSSGHAERQIESMEAKESHKLAEGDLNPPPTTKLTAQEHNAYPNGRWS